MDVDIGVHMFCIFFYKTVSSSDNILKASNDRMIGEWWTVSEATVA